VGRLYLTELVLVVLAPFLVLRIKTFQSSARFRRLILLLVLWIAAVIFSNQINNTSFDNSLRGFSRVLFFTGAFISTYALVKNNERRIQLFYLGFALSSVVRTLTTTDPAYYIGGSNIWKFGYSGVVTALLTLYATRLWSQRKGTKAVMIILAGATLNLLLGSRSIAFASYLTAALLMLSLRRVRDFQGLFDPAKSRMKNVLKLGIYSFVTLTLVLILYQALALSGYMGEWQRSKFEGQSQGPLGIYSVFLGGRLALAQTVFAIADSPISGHGSWPEDKEDLVGRYYYELKRLGFNPSAGADSVFSSGEIAIHSFFLGAWAENGILATFFWVYVFCLSIMSIIKVMAKPLPIQPLFLYLVIAFLGDFFFSPFGAGNRVLTGLVLTLVLQVEDKPSDLLD